jgi:hypothetical protein
MVGKTPVIEEESTVANEDIPSDAAAFEAVGDRILKIIEAVLVAHSEHRGAGLGAIDVREVMAALRNVPGLMPKLLRGLIGPDQVVKYVRDPFTRALVQPFAHLFDTAPDQSLAEGALSRRMLPGFFIALRLMVGGERYEHAQAVCESTLVQNRTSPEDLGKLEFWDELYADQAVVDVVADIYSRALLRLTMYEKRKQWFIRMVNSQLSAIDSMTDADGEASWEFSVQHFKMVFETIAISPDTGELSPEMSSYISENIDDKSLQEVHEVVRLISNET